MFIKFLTLIHNGNWPRPLAAMIFDGSNSFELFLSKSASDHFYQIILNYDHRFQR